MTLLINAQSIDKSYGIDALFTNISLNIFAHDRLGLIGPNGSGKSTLLKILAGLETPDAGKVNRTQNAHIVYIAQEDQFPPEHTIKTILFGAAASQLSEDECRHHIWQVTGEAPFSDLLQSATTLSGGWRKRLAIIRALLQKPNLLLMDEPTNHLDLEGILWLESILKKADFSLVLVSHDRYFLENTINTIVELNKIYPEGYFKVPGNYSHFLEKRAEFIAAQIAREQTLANKMRREQDWLNRMPKARATKAKYRIDQAEQLRADLRTVKTSNAQLKTTTIDFDATYRKTQKLLETHDLTMRRNGKLLFEKLNLTLSPGTCLGLMGQNGSGKSSLIQLLNGSLSPDDGFIEHADNLRIVHFDQKREQLDQQQTLMRALAPSGDSVFYKGETIHVAAWAKRFLFSTDQLRQPVSSLSGGEQARVLIAHLMQQAADILLLDEPTNDLDIPTLEVLEDNLSEFPGAIVLISHDRFLLSRLCDKLLWLDGNGKAEFFSDYAQWQQVTSESTTKDISQTVTRKATSTGLSYEQRRELSRLPDKIQKAETELTALEQQLQQAEISSDFQRLNQVCEQIQVAKDKINQLYQYWQELEELGK